MAEEGAMLNDSEVVFRMLLERVEPSFHKSSKRTSNQSEDRVPMISSAKRGKRQPRCVFY